MRKIICGMLLIAIMLGIAACSETAENQSPRQTAYVEAFTSGTIKRVGSNIFISLSADIPDTLRATVPASEALSIKPATAGRFIYANERTVQFIPDEALPFNTKFSIKVDFAKWFSDVSKKERYFEFFFNTAPLSLHAALSDISLTANDNYLYTVQIAASDFIDDKAVESLVNLSENPQSIEWSHASQQLSHTLKVTVTAPEKTHKLTISSGSNSEYGIESANLIDLNVLSKNELGVQNIRMVNDDTKYLEITFNKKLDPKQKLMGLAYIEENESKAVDVIENKIRLYPDYNRKVANIFLSEDIRSAGGQKLTLDAETQNLLKNYRLEVAKPKVEFASEGVIVPNSDRIQIPFNSIYMRGVQVRVFHIYQQNICQALQRGDLNSIYGANFMYVARPVAVKTIFLDEEGDKDRIKHWNYYSIDLSDIMQTEPGAIYRVELVPRAELTAWEQTDFAKETKEQAFAQDKTDFAKLQAQFSNGDWSYYDNYDDNYYYWWDEDSDPAQLYYYNGLKKRRNVLSTNIGLSAMANGESEYQIVAINLQTAQPIGDVEIELYNAQNQSIGTAKTKSTGIATINLQNNAKPLYLVARKDKDFSYLRLQSGESLSTSTFDVSGQTVENGLKGYIYGERGVWRPGDTLHISFMLNDPDKTLPENYPVSLELENPLQQVQTRLVNSNGRNGLYTFSVPTDAKAPTGRWTAYVTAGGVRFSKSIRIETIKPNRLKINISTNGNDLKYGTSIELHTEWLTGMTAHNMKYSIDAKFTTTKTTWKQYKDFIFDDPASSLSADETRVAENATDENGDATFTLRPSLEGAPGKLTCDLSTRVYEPSGEFSTDVSRITYSPYNEYVGIKIPSTDDNYLQLNTQQKFELVNVDAAGNTVGGQLKVKIYKMEWSWWWDSSNGSLASFVSDVSHKPIKTQTISTDSDGKASLPINITEWGRYLIRVTNTDSGHSTGVVCYFGDYSYMQDEQGTAAQVLSINTDKAEYNVGEKIQVNIPSSEGSTAIVSVCRGARVLSTQLVECKDVNTNVEIPVTDNMLPNAYLYISLVQPYQQTTNDRPIRLYGIKSVTVNSEQSKLKPAIAMDDEIRPESKCKITVSEKDGRPMSYTLAIVDDGLLDLTHFKTPNAWDSFNGREALGVKMWDLYSLVSGAFGGRIEQIFSIGGDESADAASKAMVNRFKPMVYFAGPFTLGKRDKNVHKIDIPDYVGSVRVMVVATDGTAYGNADKNVKVTKPLMVLPTLPRLLGVNDETTVTATLFANGSGTVETTIDVEGDAQVIGSKTQSAKFTQQGDQSVSFRLKAGKTEGSVKVRLTAKGLNDQSTAVVTLPIRAVSQNIISTTEKSIAPNAKAQFSAQNGTIEIEASTVKPLNLSNRLKFLLGIPYGCSEQITSKAFPQLLLDKFTKLTKEQKEGVENAVKTVITKLPSYQTSDGGIAIWPNSSYSSLYNSAYVSLFLTEAQNCGYYVPEGISSKLTSYLKRNVKNWKSNSYSYENATFALALYALSASRNADLSTMNRMREASGKIGNQALANLSAAYALAGHRNYAKELWSKINSDQIYPGVLIAMTACSDKGADAVAEKVRSFLVNNNYWWRGDELSLSINAMSKYYQKMGAAQSLNFDITYNKKSENVSSDKFIWRNTYAASDNIEVVNKSGANIHVVSVNSYKAVQDSIEKSSSGLTVSVNYFTSSDKPAPVNLNNLKDNTLYAVVEVSNTTGSKVESIALTHILPAGWEVLKADGDANVSYQDVRDDRVYSYVDNLNASSSFKVVLYLSATYSGSYYVPAVTAEAMYDNKIFGCSSSSHVTF